MSKVKIQANASGTGVFTVTSPATNTDRTITLPDGTGTLLNSDGDGSSLTGVGVDGIVSSADATAITINQSEQVGIGAAPSGDAILDVETAIGGKWACSVKTTHASDGMGLLVDSPNQDNTLPIFLAKSNSIERFKITTDGRGLSQFTAKGWAYWNGTGTVNLIGSHNVSSLTDQGTGNSYVIMTQAVVGNKCTLGSVSKSGGSASASNSATISTAESNPQDRMSCETYRGDGYTLRDATHVYIACFS